MGDSIQAAKAGILEIADIFVVNKSDRPGAQEAVRDLRTMLAMAPLRATGRGSRRSSRRRRRPARGSTSWSAAWTRTATGSARRASGTAGGWPGPGRRSRRWPWPSCGSGYGALPGESHLEELAGQVAAGELDPYTAADGSSAPDVLVLLRWFDRLSARDRVARHVVVGVGELGADLVGFGGPGRRTD